MSRSATMRRREHLAHSSNLLALQQFKHVSERTGCAAVVFIMQWEPFITHSLDGLHLDNNCRRVCLRIRPFVPYPNQLFGPPQYAHIDKTLPSNCLRLELKHLPVLALLQDCSSYLGCSLLCTWHITRTLLASCLFSTSPLACIG